MTTLYETFSVYPVIDPPTGLAFEERSPQSEQPCVLYVGVGAFCGNPTSADFAVFDSPKLTHDVPVDKYIPGTASRKESEDPMHIFADDLMQQAVFIDHNLLALRPSEVLALGKLTNAYDIEWKYSSDKMGFCVATIQPSLHAITHYVTPEEKVVFTDVSGHAIVLALLRAAALLKIIKNN